MGNRLTFEAESTHKAEILQSPSTKDEAKAADGYSGAQHVRQEEVIRQQPTTRTTEATSYRLFDPYYDIIYKKKLQAIHSLLYKR